MSTKRKEDEREGRMMMIYIKFICCMALITKIYMRVGVKYSNQSYCKGVKVQERVEEKAKYTEFVY